MNTEEFDEREMDYFPDYKYGCDAEKNETCDLINSCDECCYSTNPNLEKFKEEALFRWNNDLD